MINSSVPVSIARQKGISLIIVLILLVVIGLTAASAMRGATSSQRVTNNVRMDVVAQQYAEAALRFCEAQLQLADAARVNSLKVAVIPAVDMTVGGATGAWENPVSWNGPVGAGAAAATRTALNAAQYSSATSSYLPAKAPECVAETQTLGSPTFTVTVVTARGFSPDYQADGAGNTTHGAVVWLQSILNL
ncbi:PilX N-terminal domain-containing pilus assembly protein [Rhodoferax sp.]|uniref:PilX N-terminal domain-containing pilus assembly protein n=1 Tax=Rhodoferax sp. TaxID=50421 RepID=UPI0027209BC3|nr:PilX N-terminal domain-containing pilus assembly protein [Rhodoferax sp.]MDO9196205.1 PilX N-terminal domain-containing pilus assembly protein [Rhodoferax sp.]